MTISIANIRPRVAGPSKIWFRLEITTRTSWMTNNAIPDSIIMNMICWSLGFPVELNDPNVSSTEVGLTSKNTLRILNTIKLVTRAFTTMDTIKLVRPSLFPQGAPKTSLFTIVVAPSDASQAARDDKLRSAYQTKMYSLTYVCDCQKWRKEHDPNIFTPHDPTTVDLWRLRLIKQMIGTMVYAHQCTLGDEVTTTSYYDLEKRNTIYHWHLKLNRYCTGMHLHN